MKNYFAVITADHWCAKNNLEKAAHELAHEMNRRILSEEDLPDYKKEFQEKIAKLHESFPRCKALAFSIDKSYDTRGDYSVWCDGVFHIMIYLAKN